MSEAELTLRTMTRAEFDEWLPQQVAGYAALIAASGALPARGRAGEGGAGHRAALRQRGGHAGAARLPDRGRGGRRRLAVARRARAGSDPLMAWVFEIEIEAPFRGRGYGRAAMRLAEGEARARGMTSLGLNVHGQNMVARSLYESLGYEVTAMQLKKPV